MISIDGSVGEGGGQVLRTSVAVSAVTQKPVRISNIRAKRSNPGLRPQHLSAIRAVAEICDAEIKGDDVNSTEIEFSPNEIKSGKINIDIGTAGSITLVLQALMIPAIFAEDKIRIQISGGTDVRWSPSIDYLRFVTIPILQKFGYMVDMEIVQRGYYPKGGGRVILEIRPSNISRIGLEERGDIEFIGGVSHAHSDLERNMVAKRQATVVRSLLFKKFPDKEIKINKEYINTLSYGSGITLWAETNNSIIGADALGEKGKRSEDVGNEAAENLINEIESGAALDKYMADQIVPYLAIAGGEVSVSGITGHAKTNVDIVNKFGFDVRIEGNVIKALSV